MLVVVVRTFAEVMLLPWQLYVRRRRRPVFYLRPVQESTVQTEPPAKDNSIAKRQHYFRFHLPHAHLTPVFGSDWFALKAEAFARFFGTSVFLVSQTVVVAVWIALNIFGYTHFDVYPFILLNLAFSLQAAYAAPLILLAQTRQAERDKVYAEADAQHREALAQASEQRLELSVQQSTQMMALLQQNTELTQLVKEMSEHIERLTSEMHGKAFRLDSQ